MLFFHFFISAGQVSLATLSGAITSTFSTSNRSYISSEIAVKVIAVFPNLSPYPKTKQQLYALKYVERHTFDICAV